MKTITLLCIYTVAVVLNLPYTATAQKGQNGYNSFAMTTQFLPPFEKKGFKETRSNNININAVRDFVKTFKGAENNKWYKTEDGGFTSTFRSDGIETNVAYNGKGVRKYIIRIYKENHLPFEIRDIVKREYYDAMITLVREINTGDETAFLVHLEDKNSWKIVRVADGEMKLIENLRKG